MSLIQHVDPGILAPSSSTLNNGIIAHWKLGEASGQRNDSVGSNHLTDNNTVTQAAGKVGNAAQFTVANIEFLSLADNADMSTGDIDFSFIGFTYFDSLVANRAIVSKYKTTGNQREYSLRYDQVANRFRFLLSSNGTSVTTKDASTFGAPSISTWYMFYIEHDSVGNTMGISINNGALDTLAYSSGVSDMASDFQIGSEDGVNIYHNGRTDAVSFYKRLLTAAERTEYDAGVQWPF